MPKREGTALAGDGGSATCLLLACALVMFTGVVPSRPVENQIFGTNLAAGQLLQGRFVLMELLYHAGSSLPFPAATEKKYKPEELLGKGGFGVTWKALDKNNRREVAVKLFHYEGAYVTGGWWNRIFGSVSTLIGDAKKECDRVQTLIGNQNTAGFPKGAEYICQCLEQHIETASKSEPIFIVQEFCGTYNLQEVIDTKTYFSYSIRVEDARMWTSNVLNGIAFLSSSNEPLSHRDIKPANVVISDDFQTAKLIDFGAMQRFDKRVGITTPSIIPPECKEALVDWQCPYAKSNRAAADAYDVWGAGIIFKRLLQKVGVGKVDRKDWKILDGLRLDWPNRTKAVAAAEELDKLR